MAASNFTNLYNNGQWGYMGIGPMPAKSFTLTLKADSDHPLFTLGACDYTHIVAYNPNNTSQYAVYSGTSFTVYNNGGSFELVTIYGGGVDVPDEQTITIDYDPSKWDFHGLESLEGAAICIATNEYGSSPDGSDYASISTDRKVMFWYEVNVIVMVDKINSCDIYAKRAELDANGNVISSLPASTSADANKVLTVNASGDAEWATPATPAPVTVDQTYNAASANAQSGVAVAQAIAAIPAPSVDEVPDVTSYSDAGKVLTASWDLSTGQGSYAWETPNFSVGTWETINLTNTEYGYYYGDSANGLQKNTMYLLRISVVPASNVPSTVLYLRVAINNSNRDPRGQSVDKVVVRVPWDPTSPSYSGAPFIVTTAIPVSYNPSDSSQPEGTGFAVCASTTSSTSPSETYLSSVSVWCLPLGSISAS